MCKLLCQPSSLQLISQTRTKKKKKDPTLKKLLQNLYIMLPLTFEAIL